MHTASMYKSMVVGWWKVGDTPAAMRYFAEMKARGFIPDVATYNTLVKGLTMNNEMEGAMGLAQEMWLWG